MLILFRSPGAHLRKASSQEAEKRRSSLGHVPTIRHRASDAFLDPHHAAILFRDSRGVSYHIPLVPSTEFLRFLQYCYYNVFKLISNIFVKLVLSRLNIKNWTYNTKSSSAQKIKYVIQCTEVLFNISSSFFKTCFNSFLFIIK